MPTLAVSQQEASLIVEGLEAICPADEPCNVCPACKLAEYVRNSIQIQRGPPKTDRAHGGP